MNFILITIRYHSIYICLSFYKYFFVYMLQIVTAYKPKDSDKSLALDPISLEKNRNTDFIPLYPKRVKLPFLPGVEGSDYINATYLQVTLHEEFY